MKTFTKEEIQSILLKHSLWLLDKPEGERADLRYADLRSADLRYADLRSANLRSADLSSADLRSADLRSANLRSADLSYANLRSADLRYANLRSAINAPVIIQISPIGSRNDCLQAEVRGSEIELSTGCFKGSCIKFLKQVEAKHGDSKIGNDYKNAVKFITVWAKSRRTKGLK
jgi:hypothetical protein